MVLLECFSGLRGIDPLSVVLRLTLAMIFGGMIGMERGQKHRPAGFRTYMIVCVGAALTMILGQYEAHMFATQWKTSVQSAGLQTDVARFSAQVINGIGFLGAGTIIVTGRQETKGLTTAAALWASACIGLAIGAGFYECVLWGLFLIVACVRVLPLLEHRIIDTARNMNIYMEFDSMDCIEDILNCMKTMDIDIYNMDIDRNRDNPFQNPKAIFAIRLRYKFSHARILAELSKIENIRILEEI